MSMSEMEYTRLLKSVQDDLGKEFGVFRTKEEYLYLRKIVTSRIEILKSKHRYDNEIETYSDPKIRNLFSRIGNLLDSALPDRRDDVPLLPLKIESRTQYLELLNKYDELAEYLITQESVDEKFYSLLSTKLEKYYNSEDYIRRLVIRRLIKISPEFVCKKGIHGNPSNDAEGFALDSEQNRILDEKVFFLIFGRFYNFFIKTIINIT